MTDFIPGGKPLKMLPFTRYIRKWRIENNMCLGNMAQRLDIGSAELSAIESGKKPLTHKHLDRVIGAYPKIDIDKLTLAFNQSQPTDQRKINQYAQSIIDLTLGENSSIVSLAMLSVFEYIATDDKCSAANRRATAELLEEQALRIRSTMRLQPACNCENCGDLGYIYEDGSKVSCGLCGGKNE